MNRSILTLAIALSLSTVTANAAILQYYAVLAPEAVGATGSGFASFQVDTTLAIINIQAEFSGLSGTTTIAHIHCCTTVPGTGTVGVAVTPGTLPGFPVGVNAASYITAIDLSSQSSYTGNFFSSAGGTSTLAAALLLSGFNSNRAYFNVHTTTFGGGEIRGFIQPVPEPSAFALAAAGLGSLLAVAARRRRAVR